MTHCLRTLFLASAVLLNFSCATSSAKDLDIVSLCETVGPTSSIVALGESTHGTKEFNTYRTEIVRELVSMYDYRLFVLEADYMASTKINQYILTGEGDPIALLESLNLWPWYTQGFLDLIIWMKDFNRTHLDNPIQFFGMDTQFYQIYVDAQKRNYPQQVISSYKSATIDRFVSQFPQEAKIVVEIENNVDLTSQKIKSLRKLSCSLREKESVNIELQYFILSRIYNYSFVDTGLTSVRDENMAIIVDLIHKRENKKLIVWAHNGHIFRKEEPIHKFVPLGQHLTEMYKDDYVVIGFDFLSGAFNAYSRDTEDMYKRRVFQHKPNVTTLASTLDFGNRNYLITDCSTLKKQVYINSIGATYISNQVDSTRYTSRIIGTEQFDYIVNIKESLPSILLSNK